jgi:hypothetical protein
MLLYVLADYEKATKLVVVYYLGVSIIRLQVLDSCVAAFYALHIFLHIIMSLQYFNCGSRTLYASEKTNFVMVIKYEYPLVHVFMNIFYLNN